MDRRGVRQQSLIAAAAAVVCGAVLLVWPALLNGYPIVFSDTHAFLVQGGEPQMVWDKPFAYGPLLRLVHGRASLWLPLLAQGLMVSHLLWLVRAAFGTPSALGHLVICALLAGFSTLPWVTALLMPDVFTGVTILALFLLGFGDRLDVSGRVWAGLLATVAISVHLSHLIVAATCIMVIGLLRFDRARVAVLPLFAALAILLGTNLVAYKKFAISPYGSVFLLARLAADGPVQATLARDCPRPDWRLCGWVGRLPADSDQFLWDGQGPVWTYPGGPSAMAREASAILAATFREEPWHIAEAAVENTIEQLFLFQLGDTLGTDYLETSITGSLRAYFPPVEMERFRAGLQMRDELRAYAAPLAWPLAVAMGVGLLVTLWLMARVFTLRGRVAGGLAAMVLAGMLANAVATGALSKPHHRYQARVVWLLLAVPLLAVRVGQPPEG